MRNLKKVLCLALVLTMVLAVVSGAAYTNYVDDADITFVNSEYVIAAQMLQDLGIVIGKEENGSYKYDPKGDFDRASMARVLYVLHTGFGENNPYNQGDVFANLYCPFTDIDGVWASAYIKYGYAQGYLSGKSATTFDPYAPVNAQEMATALLAVLGYDKKDLAKDYPNNVVKYAYTKDRNLFTSGLSLNEGATAGGHHIVALYNTKFGSSSLLSPDREAETEFGLTQALNREQAFYMMYKAITKFNVVTKVEGNLTLDDGKLVASLYNYACSDKTFLEERFGKKLTIGTDAGVIVASADKGIAGISGKSAKSFTILRTNGTKDSFIDFGYNASIARTQGTGFYAFNLDPVDWNAMLYKYVDFRTYNWGNGTYAADYQFDYHENAYTTVSDFNGTIVDMKKDVEITADNGKLVVGTGDDAVAYSLYEGGAYLSINGADYAKKTAAEIATEIGDANGKKASDALKVYLVNGKIFAIDEAELTLSLAEISAANAAAGKLVVAGVTYIDAIGAEDGDWVRMYVTEDADGNKVANGYVVTKLEKQDVTVKTDKAGKVTYFMEDGTQLIAGASDYNLSDTISPYGVYLDALAALKVNANTHYFDLYMDGGYLYAATAIAKTEDVDLTSASKTCTYNTASGKYNYTVTFKAADGTAYTLTKADDNGALTFDASHYKAVVDVKTGEYEVVLKN